MIRKFLLSLSVIAAMVLTLNACTATMANGRGGDSHAGHVH